MFANFAQLEPVNAKENEEGNEVEIELPVFSNREARNSLLKQLHFSL